MLCFCVYFSMVTIFWSHEKTGIESVEILVVKLTSFKSQVVLLRSDLELLVFFRGGVV